MALPYNVRYIVTMENTQHTAEYDALEVRCPDCGVDATRLPPCRICGYINGCCICYHADDARVLPPGVTE